MISFTKILHSRSRTLALTRARGETPGITHPSYSASRAGPCSASLLVTCRRDLSAPEQHTPAVPLLQIRPPKMPCDLLHETRSNHSESFDVCRQRARQLGRRGSPPEARTDCALSCSGNAAALHFFEDVFAARSFAAYDALDCCGAVLRRFREEVVDHVQQALPSHNGCDVS